MLKRSTDRKVTTAVSPNGKTGKVGNSFGLPSGKAFSCPGATTVCEKVCYAGKLEKLFPAVRTNLTHNWDALQNKTVDEMYTLLDAMVRDFVAETEKVAKRTKTFVPLKFRIHWDGDFFSADYAEAWARVISDHSTVQFWVYTRSFTDTLNVLPVFDKIDRANLALYLSVDSANVMAAGKARKAFPWAKWAYLAETFAAGRDDLSAHESKVYDCPEIKGSVPMIDKKGSACIRCGICVSGRGDVIFSISKRKGA